MFPFSAIILAIVFILIAVRQIGKIRLEIWQIMLGGAIAVLLTMQISLREALKSINLDVMLFLFGMFIVGRALHESGYLSSLSYKLFKDIESSNYLILALLFGFGFASALLMNDTMAIIGTPIVLLLAKEHNLEAKLLLLTLAFAITIGSVMSPIGNPQNLLIALHDGISNPFVEFLKWLFIPTMINLFAAYLLLKLFYSSEFYASSLTYKIEENQDKNLKVLSKLSLIIIASLVALKILFVLLQVGIDFKLTYIALSAAFPIIIFSEKRLEIIKKIDWKTLVFFASMFVLMESVWISGIFQEIIRRSGINIITIPAILMVSTVLSQFISNVPLVGLYLPMLTQAGASTKELLALAAGSTIAGNLFILGAASNIIIIQNAEREGETLTFYDFAKIGIPLTIINVIVYGVFLHFF